MNVDNVLNTVAIKYSECSSYQDHGTIKVSGLDSESSEIEFTTHFTRPGLFKFEWTENTNQFTIWSDGIKSFERYPDTEYKTESVDSLESAIAGATGISFGGAWLISSLLIPKLGQAGKSLLSMKDAAFLGEEEFDSATCYSFKGSLNVPGDTTVLVSAKDFSIRRITEDYVISPEEYKRNMKIAVAAARQQGSRFDLEESLQCSQNDGLHYQKWCTYKGVSFDDAISASTFHPYS